MTIEQFRRHKFLPHEWSKLLRTNGILQAVLKVMDENHPCRFTVNPDKNGDISPTRANIELGMTRGYSKYGGMLELLAQPISDQQDVGESTYEPVKETE